MRAILGCGLAVVLAVSAAAAEDKKDTPLDGKKLVGKWEPKDAKKDSRTVMEFTADGKLSLTVDPNGKLETYRGVYKLSGNKLTVTVRIKDEDKTQDVVILNLTDDELQTEDPKGKKESFKRVRGDK